MKRKIVLFLVLSILFSSIAVACTADGNSKDTTQSTIINDVSETSETKETETKFNEYAEDVSDVRIVVNGDVDTFDAKLYEDDWYITPEDVNTALGIEVTPTHGEYVNLHTVVKDANYSYEHDDIFESAYIWTDEEYGSILGNSSFIPENLTTDTERQITSVEFRELLISMISEAAPDKLAWFEKNVTTYDKPMLRGEGFVMAYYAAICVGADVWNNGFDNSKADGGDFWDSGIYEFESLYPNIWSGPVKFSNGDIEWDSYFVAAFLWSFWYSSPVSGYQVFDFDDASSSMHQNEPLTVNEAINAAIRILDSNKEPQQYVPIDDEMAVCADNMIVTSSLLEKANKLPEITQDNMPILNGFVLPDGRYERREIGVSESDIRNIANWGFNSIRLMVTYQTLFDATAENVDIVKLKELDKIVALAIKYNLHLDIVTFSLPGRWTYLNEDTYEVTADLDLYTNQKRQKEVYALWGMLAERYKDVPGAALSFCPTWEILNKNLSTGRDVKGYTNKDVINVYINVADIIKEHDPDRLIVIEPTPNNVAEVTVNESKPIMDAMFNEFSDTLMMLNFCENPFVYAEMTAVQGAHIDYDNRSMFKPGYPTTIYAAQSHIESNEPLEMTGALKAGTSIELYLSYCNRGEISFVADGETIYSESTLGGSYETEAPLSGFYPYAKSEKCVSFVLPTDVDDLQISIDNGWFDWCGIDVTLPREYAVDRWWFPSGYDAFNSGDFEQTIELRETSTIMISPNRYDEGRHLTINEDITFSSDVIAEQSNLETIEEWANTVTQLSPNIVVRFEGASFNVGCIHESAIQYYDDMLSVFNKYGLGWYSNDYWNIMTANYSNFAGVEPVWYKGSYIDAEMIELMQEHQ